MRGRIQASCARKCEMEDIWMRGTPCTLLRLPNGLSSSLQLPVLKLPWRITSCTIPVINCIFQVSRLMLMTIKQPTVYHAQEPCKSVLPLDFSIQSVVTHIVFVWCGAILGTNQGQIRAISLCFNSTTHFVGLWANGQSLSGGSEHRIRTDLT